MARPWILKSRLCFWRNYGMAERYTHHWRRIRTTVFSKAGEPSRRGPYRRRVTAGFKYYLWERGEVLPYPGHYEVWRKEIPRWLAKRRSSAVVCGRYAYLYIEH